ncbi:MAG TPA: IPT/TIG domain-containing protein [Gemmatimonadota bacterium]|nr:IPT/TIG domain-containing protein [Gemmatimonadota bacterium]
MFPTRVSPLTVLAASVLTACSGGGGGNGGPMTPDPPVVSGIAPAQARVGETVTISGSGFGTSASAVTVTIRGTAAPIGSVTATAITATIPVIAPGPATVAVSVGGSAAGQVAFTVEQTPPVITSIEPAAIRAGGEITIRGEGFLEPVTAALVPADVAYVQLDNGALEQLPIQARDWSKIVALVPAHITPGNHDVVVEVGSQTARREDVAFHVPTIRGSFAAFGSIDFNTLNGLSVGLRMNYDFWLDEQTFDPATGTGTLEGKLNGFFPVTGTFEGSTGGFELGGPITQDKNYFFTGTLGHDDEGRAIVLDGELRATRNTGGELRFKYDAAILWSENLIDVTKLTVALGDIATGNGPLPEATYQYNANDPLTWDPVTMLAGQLIGEWFMSTQPEPHIGTFDGTVRYFFDDLTLGGRLMLPIQAYFTPLNSSQRVTLVGTDANGNETGSATFGAVDNIGVANPVTYQFSPEPFTHTGVLAVSTEGDGFTAGKWAGVNLTPDGLPELWTRPEFGFE